MSKRMRTPTLLALLIAALLTGAYLIVAKNGAAMTGSGAQTPAGIFH